MHSSLKLKRNTRSIKNYCKCIKVLFFLKKNFNYSVVSNFTSGWSEWSGPVLALLNLIIKEMRRLKPVYTEHLRMRHSLTPMMDANSFYIEMYRKTQTLSLGVNGPLNVCPPPPPTTAPPPPHTHIHKLLLDALVNLLTLIHVCESIVAQNFVR